MRDALNAFVIRGISSNIPFQAALMQHPVFHSGIFDHRLHPEALSDRLRCLDGAARRSGAAGLGRRLRHRAYPIARRPSRDSCRATRLVGDKWAWCA